MIRGVPNDNRFKCNIDDCKLLVIDDDDEDGNNNDDDDDDDDDDVLHNPKVSDGLLKYFGYRLNISCKIMIMFF